MKSCLTSSNGLYFARLFVNRCQQKTNKGRSETQYSSGWYGDKPPESKIIRDPLFYEVTGVDWGGGGVEREKDAGGAKHKQELRSQLRGSMQTLTAKV